MPQFQIVAKTIIDYLPHQSEAPYTLALLMPMPHAKTSKNTLKSHDALNSKVG